MHDMSEVHMEIVVPIRMEPDPVEELDPHPSGDDIDRDWIEFVVNEYDDHAIEEAVLVKEAIDEDVTITVVGLDTGHGDIEQTLYMAAAKDVDNLVKITDVPTNVSTTEAASLFVNYLDETAFDAVFTGVQSAEDRDGQLAPKIGAQLDVPHLSVVTRVDINGAAALAEKEFSGGMSAEYNVDLPAVFGIQSAHEAPRYVPVTQVRNAMRSATITTVSADEIGADRNPQSEIVDVAEPETGEGAEMIRAPPEQAVEELLDRLEQNGIEV